MLTTAREVFSETVRALSPTERLRLAALILADLARSGMSVVDAGEVWSEEDQADLTAFALSYAVDCYPEDEALA